MKLTITFIALLSVATSWAENKNKAEDAKDKREAAVGYPSSSHSYQTPSLGNDGASAISIGAGYSVGGAKPSYSSYEGQGFTGSHSLSSEGLPSSGHATIQLPPITLQPSHGNIVGSDLSQLMSQLQQSINSGALTLQAPGGYGGLFQSEGHNAYSGQEQSQPQFSFVAPKLQQYSVAEQPQASVPSYAAGTKGLGSYSSTGPVLFNPADAKSNVRTFNYASPSSGHSFGSNGAISLTSGGQSFGGLSGSYGGSGQSHTSPYKSFSTGSTSSGKNAFKPSAYIGSSVQGDSSHQGLSAISGSSYGSPSVDGASASALSLGSGSHSGLSLGSDSYGGQSLGSGSYGGQSLGSGSYGGQSLGAGSFGGHTLSSSSLSGHSPSYGSFAGYTLGSGSLGGHSLSPGSHGGLSLGSGGLSGLSLSSGGHGSHGGLSFSSGGHGASFDGAHDGFGGGSSKYVSAYLPSKSDGFGSASSSTLGLTVPPATSYGIPSSSYSFPSATHSASSHRPQYYVPKSQSSYSGFGAGSSSYRSPSSSLSSLSSYPKYSSGSHSSLSSQYGSAKDPLQGAYSENSYNTIKYSEELKAVN
ncbi:uncharacterized protein [Choristoneura fumiferana]|uniref:uncharacterized protein n=1 Tax=Choristoneura fumiferana TaxID=7141 RepID=UPI003D1593A9